MGKKFKEAKSAARRAAPFESSCKYARATSLHLVADLVTNKGLTAILDNCPRLEYLNILDCPHIRMDDNLANKCACIIMDNYEYCLPQSPGGFYLSPRYVWDIEDDSEDNDDSSSAYYYLLDVDDAESVLDNKSMLRYT